MDKTDPWSEDGNREHWRGWPEVMQRRPQRADEALEAGNYYPGDWGPRMFEVAMGLRRGEFRRKRA